MSWVGRFGTRAQSIVTQDELFAAVMIIEQGKMECTLCDNPAVGVVHCNDCGWTRRLCDSHRPTSSEVAHLKTLHTAIHTER